MLCSSPHLSAYRRSRTSTTDTLLRTFLLQQGEDGWFKPIRYTLIREMLRRKFNHLLQYGRPLPDGECDELKRAAEDEQLEVDGRLGERSSGEEDGAWADLGEGDNATDKGKGKSVAKGKRKAKRKSLSALLTTNSGSRSKAVRRARQVGVSDALELVRAFSCGGPSLSGDSALTMVFFSRAGGATGARPCS